MVRLVPGDRSHVERAATASGVTGIDLQVDADPNQLVETLGVHLVPMLITMHDGTGIARLTGLQPVDTIDALFVATQTGTVTVTPRAAPALVASRSAAGLALGAAGLLLDTGVLVVGSAVLIGSALAGLGRRSS